MRAYYAKHGEKINASKREMDPEERLRINKRRRELRTMRKEEINRRARSRRVEKRALGINDYKRRDKEKLRVWNRKAETERRKKNPVVVKARDAVRNRVRYGTLNKGPCIYCGSLEVDAHHTDYSRPLDVEWLCKKHHRAWHRVFEAEGYE